MSLHSAGGIRSTSSAGLGAEVSSCAKPGAKGSNEQLTNIQGPEFGTAASQLPDQASPKVSLLAERSCAREAAACGFGPTQTREPWSDGLGGNQ